MRDVAYLQYGCGWSAPQDWDNYDASPTLFFEKLPLIGHLYSKNENRFPSNVLYGDIVKGLPVRPSSFKGVYCSHVLEHLSLNDFRLAIRNTKLILEPGGVFRLVMPDLEYFVNKYIHDTSGNRAQMFMRETALGLEVRPRGIREFIIDWFGNSRHLYLWDYRSIVPELESAGFIDVRRAVMGDSSDSAFKSVEVGERWKNCLGVECRNPQ